MDLRTELIEAIETVLDDLAAMQDLEEELEEANQERANTIIETLTGLGRHLAMSLDILAPHLLLWQQELEADDEEDLDEWA